MWMHHETYRQEIAPVMSLPTVRPLPGAVNEKQRNSRATGLNENSPLTCIRSVVVPLDGSLHAEHALPYALAIARRAGAVVKITQAYCRFDVTNPWEMFSYELDIPANERKRQEYLANVAERISRNSDLTIKTVLTESDDTKDAWVKTTKGADLIVMGTSRGGLLPRLWTREPVEVLRRHSESPLLLVPGYSFPVDLTGDPFPKNVLVPLDGSMHAERILRPASAIAALENSFVTLLNVQNERWNRGTFENTTPVDYLQSVVRSTKAVTQRVAGQVLTTDGNVARGIVTYAKQHGADLIAMATEADGRFTRFLRGSVVDSLLRRSTIPMLIQGFDHFSKRPEITYVS